MNIKSIAGKSSLAMAAAAFAGLGLGSGSAVALPVNGTGNVTNAVIMGTGIGNGSWTGINDGTIELALRGKLRYNGAGDPENTFNYDGIDTYVFDPSLSLIPANRSVFNFEFSINSDPTGINGTDLDSFVYSLLVDIDPTAGTDFLTVDPTAFLDNSYGDNATAESAGVEGTFGALGSTNNLMQNSQNLGFGYTAFPQLPGRYTFELTASDNVGVIGRTSIDIVVVPEPGTLALFGLGLAGLGIAGRKRAL